MSQHKIKLIAKLAVAKDTPGFRFEKPAGFDFLPGQSVVLQVLRQASSSAPLSGASADRQDKLFPKETDSMRDMTIASSPTEDYLDFVVRQGRSAYKQALTAMQPGDEAVIFGPKGKFVFETTIKPIVMLAGGIGITPFISILRYIKDKDLHQEVLLFYSNPTIDRIAYKDEITEIKKSSSYAPLSGASADRQKSKNYKFNVIHTLTKKAPENWDGESGRIDAAMIKKYVADIENAVYYICGSTSMAEETKRIVSDLGVSQESIKKEEFTGY